MSGMMDLLTDSYVYSAAVSKAIGDCRAGLFASYFYSYGWEPGWHDVLEVGSKLGMSEEDTKHAVLIIIKVWPETKLREENGRLEIGMFEV